MNWTVIFPCTRETGVMCSEPRLCDVCHLPHDLKGNHLAVLLYITSSLGFRLDTTAIRITECIWY